MRDFNFHVSNLEKAILHLLENGDEEMSPAMPGMTGVKTFATYAGELDRETLILSLQALAPKLPLVLVSYGSGKDKQKTATGYLNNEPIENEHTCGFMVIVACNDLRGEKGRKTVAFQMIGEARQLLGGVQFEIEIEGEENPELLNHSPIMFAGVETIGRLKDLTAYAVHFTTSFKEWTPDRRNVTVYPADEILLDIQPNDNPPSVIEFNLPGVTGEMNED